MTLCTVGAVATEVVTEEDFVPFLDIFHGRTDFENDTAAYTL